MGSQSTRPPGSRPETCGVCLEEDAFSTLDRCRDRRGRGRKNPQERGGIRASPQVAKSARGTLSRWRDIGSRPVGTSALEVETRVQDPRWIPRRGPREVETLYNYLMLERHEERQACHTSSSQVYKGKVSGQGRGPEAIGRLNRQTPGIPRTSRVRSCVANPKECRHHDSHINHDRGGR
jgi:hypothetical protein